MKERKKFILGVLLILLVTGSCFHNYFEPTRYFRSSQIPLLISPAKPESSDEAGDDRANKAEEGPTPHAQSINLLLLAIDARNEEKSRTDVIMLVHLKPAQKSVKIVSIPRDTRVRLPNIGETKINHAHLLGEQQGGNRGGTQATLAVVSTLLQCEIHYYLKINFAGFVHFIDTIGGIDIELPYPLVLTHSQITLPAQKQRLDGNLTLQLVRERYSLQEGDLGRQKHQVMVLQALLNKLLGPENLRQIPQILKQIRNDVVDTNLRESDIISMAWLLQGMTAQDIKHILLPGQEGRAFDHLVKARLYYWVPDLAEVEKIREEYLN